MAECSIKPYHNIRRPRRDMSVPLGPNAWLAGLLGRALESISNAVRSAPIINRIVEPELSHEINELPVMFMG